MTTLSTLLPGAAPNRVPRFRYVLPRSESVCTNRRHSPTDLQRL